MTRTPRIRLGMASHACSTTCEQFGRQMCSFRQVRYRFNSTDFADERASARTGANSAVRTGFGGIPDTEHSRTWP